MAGRRNVSGVACFSETETEDRGQREKVGAANMRVMSITPTRDHMVRMNFIAQRVTKTNLKEKRLVL